MANKQWKCGRCGKRHHTKAATLQHISQLHGGVGEAALVKPRDDEDLSIAQSRRNLDCMRIDVEAALVRLNVGAHTS